jgi:Holliday junction DNA helicase RuvB
MTTPSRIVTPERRSDDVGDTALRPQLLSEFVGQAQAASAVAAASRSAGEKAETAQLIRLGRKDLAK